MLGSSIISKVSLGVPSWPVTWKSLKVKKGISPQVPLPVVAGLSSGWNCTRTTPTRILRGHWAEASPTPAGLPEIKDL